MAVKQNNTEANGSPSAVSGNAGTASGGGAKANPTSGGVVTGAGTNTNLMNGNNPDGSGDGNAEQPGCSGTGGATQKLNANAANASGMGGANAGANAAGATGNLPPKANDISYILQLIEFVELKQQTVEFGQEILKIYQHLIVELARVQIPRNSPEELKHFKDDIAKVGAFFGKANEKRVYVFYLRVVCQLITQMEEGETGPSCAIAIIFQLFNAEMVIEAVQSLLEHKIPDQNIRRTVRLLSDWLRMCNFCQNLNLWIMAILSGLQEQQKYALIDEIALENIEQLFASLILPVLRPKVAPIVFSMLSSINHTPQVFHKILPKFPRVFTCFKQQANSRDDYADETKKFVQQLVDLTSALMVRFYGYDDLYEPVELAIKDYRPSYNYLNFANAPKSQDDCANDPLLYNNTNARVGLVNLGNTCYMNSVLQALAMTKEFSREILLSQSKSPLLVKMQQQIALMLYSMRYELTPSRVLNATRPPGFSPGLQQDSSEFLGYLLETLHEQEMVYRPKKSAIAMSPGAVAVDAAADLNAKASAKQFAENTHTEAMQDTAGAGDAGDAGGGGGGGGGGGNAGAAGLATDGNVVGTVQTTPATITTTTSNVDSQSTNLRSANSAPSERSPTAPAAQPQYSAASVGASAHELVHSTIDKTFTGQLATTYKCLACGWKSRNVDSFRDFQLSFPEMKNECASNYSVQDLIDYYCSPEKLCGDNQYFCEKCKKLTDAERYINVISAPKNLILTLKHFKYDQKYNMRAKLMHKVFHDEKVSVKVCSAESLDEIASIHYDLYAGVVHSGFSMDSGHYYTYASDAANKWYKFNDSIVTPSKSEELHNLTPPNTPYILFYQMSARSNEPQEAQASTKVVKVDIPVPLQLEELPGELRDYVTHDNCAFAEELKLRRFKRANAAAALQQSLRGNGNRRGGYDDDDEDDQPPPTSGCGGNAMNINVNRFVY